MRAPVIGSERVEFDERRRRCSARLKIHDMC